MNKKETIYLAGHRGLVGSAVERQLRQNGYTTILTRTHAELDLTDQHSVDQFFTEAKPDCVILAAARVGGILANSTRPAEFLYENLMIASNVIHASWKHGVPKLINLGSSCIYPKHAPQPLTESSLLTGPLEPTNEAYAVAKISTIKLCRHYNDQYGTNFVSAMPTNLYGPGDNFDLETSHVLPALIRRFAEARGAAADGTDAPVTLWGDGSPMREFLYVDDLAEAIVFLAEHVNATDMAWVCPDYFVNVGTGSDVPIAELATTVAEVLGWKGELSWDTSKPNGTPRKLMDVTAIQKLGWTARTGLREGIERTWAWYQEHAS